MLGRKSEARSDIGARKEGLGSTKSLTAEACRTARNLGRTARIKGTKNEQLADTPDGMGDMPNGKTWQGCVFDDLLMSDGGALMSDGMTVLADLGIKFLTGFCYLFFPFSIRISFR